MKSKTRNEEGILKAKMLWVGRQKVKTETMESNAIKRAKRISEVQLNVLSRRKGKSKKETERLDSLIHKEA